MEPRCTCGTVLPPGARFCHKCGKPQFEDQIPATKEDVPDPVQQSLEHNTTAGPALSAGISFKNSRAVVVSLIVAAGAMICFLPIAYLAPSLFPVFLFAVGFVAVRLYKGRSSESLSGSAGARLGWMTGLWIFLVFAVIMALTAIMVANRDLWQQLQDNWARMPQAQTAAFTSMSQHDFLVRLLVLFPFFFFLFTLLPGLGGILGAKLSLRKRTS